MQSIATNTAKSYTAVLTSISPRLAEIQATVAMETLEIAEDLLYERQYRST